MPARHRDAEGAEYHIHGHQHRYHRQPQYRLLFDQVVSVHFPISPLVLWYRHIIRLLLAPSKYQIASFLWDQFGELRAKKAPPFLGMPWDRFLVQFQILAHRQGDGTGHHAADQPLDDGLHAHQQHDEHKGAVQV